MNNLTCRVLLIDDDQDDYVIVRDLLADIATTEFDLEWVDDYEVARQSLAHRQYDVCLLDYRLGGATGVELVREFAGGGTPFILLTGNEDHEVDVAAAQAGAADYLLKGHINAPLLERSIRYAIERKKTEAALLHAQRFAQATVDALPGHIAVLDSRGTIIAVNATWREFAASNGFVGASSGIGTNYLAICDQSDDADGRAAAACIRAVIAGEEPMSALEYPCQSSTAPQWFRVSATRFPGDGPLHVVVAHEDITERKQAEKAQHFLASIVESSQDSILTIDFDRIITSWNKSAEQLYGYPAAEVIGKPLTLLTLPEDLQELLNNIDRIKHSETVEIFDTIRVNKDGREMNLEVVLSPVKDGAGRVIGVSTLARDITERKRGEERLLQSEANLVTAQQMAHLGSWEWELTPHQDWRENRVHWSDEVFRIFGYAPGEVKASFDIFERALPEADRPRIEAITSQAILDKKSYSLDHRVLRADGTERVVHEQANFVFDADGQPIKIVGTVQDITERKLAEDALHQSEAHLRFVVDASNDGIWEWDITGGKVFWSEQIYTRLGLSPESFNPNYENQTALIHPDDVAPFEQAIQVHLETGQPYHLRVRYRHSNGSYVHVLAQGQLQRDAEGKPLRMVGSFSDLTSLIQAEAEREAKSREIVTIWESMSDAFYSLDAKWHITRLNSEASRLMQDSAENLIGRKLWDLYPSAVDLKFYTEFHRAMEEQVPVSYEEFFPPHNTWYEVHAYPSPLGLAVYFRDITERKRAEETLRESNEKFFQLANNIDDAFWMRSPDMRELLYLSPAFERIWGRSIESLYANAGQWHEFIFSEDREFVSELYATLQRDAPTISCEYRIVRPDGEIRWVHTRGFQVRNDAGELIRLTGVASDITERKQVQDSLRESEARSSAVIQYALDCIITIDHEGRVVEFNPAAEATFGYTRAEALGQGLNDLIVPPTFQEGHTKGIANFLATGEGPLLNRRIEMPARRKDGTEISVELAVNAITHLDPPLFTASLRDITERKQADEALRQSEAEFRSLAEAMPQIVWITRRDGWNTYFSQQWMDYTGLTLAESLGHGWNKPFHPDDQQRAWEAWQHATATLGDYSLECRLRRADGDYRWWLIRGVPLQDGAGNIIKWFGTCTDIHDLKLAEDGLRASEERFQSIVTNVPGLVFQFVLHADGSTEIPFVSQGSHELLELQPDEIQHDASLLLRLIRPEDRDAFGNSMARSASQLTPWVWEGHFKSKSGKNKWVQGAARPQRLPDGNTVWDALLMDITERKEAEEERDRFFTLSLDMLCIADHNGYFKRLNPAFEATLGFSNAELMAVPFLEFVHPDDIADTLAGMAKLNAGIQTMHFENRYRCRDGSYRWLRWMSAPFEDLWYCVAHDVTAMREAEAALQQANDELELRVEERTAKLQVEVLERQRAEREVRAQARQHEAVADLGRQALLDFDLDTLLAGAVSLIATTLNVDICSFWERVPDSDTLRLRNRIGLGEEVQPAPERIIGGDSHLGYSAFINEPVIAEDLEHETRFDRSPFLQENGIVSAIAVPVHDGVLYGILSACSTKMHKFSQNETYFLQTLANVLANAIERHQVEAKILQLNTNLQGVNESLRVENIQHQMTMETLRQVADALQLAKEEAERAMQEANAANQAKSEFLSRMSHELRTPMNAILGYGQILEMRNYVPDIGKEVEAILKAGRHLLDLINEVLDISRIEAGHLSLSLEPVPVGLTTRIALDLVQPLTTVRGIQLVHDNSAQEESTKQAEHHVFADQQRIKQVLVNLLSNAIKYNSEGGQVFVSTTVTPGESVKFGDYGEIECSGKMRFSVRDTGPGIDPSDFPKLFLPFERLGAERTGVEGTGIGLSLCKRLVEAMNGDIGVESVPGVGSTFWVEFPLVSVASGMRPTGEETIALPEAASRQDAPGDALTILYIEDNTSNFAVVKYAFALQGRVINLLGAEQGSVGLDLARSHQPDLILLDLHLPDMMGDAVLQRLQAEPSTCAIPVIILSADATPRQIERLLAAGATAYLTKPLDLQRFFSVLEKTLDEREQ